MLADWLTRLGLSAQYQETHTAVVALTEDRAYKVKKPVRLPFVDLTTPAARFATCVREVSLNRRLAPDVYLGLAAVTDRSGRVVDHAVVMRRLPEARRLDHLLATDRAERCLSATAESLAALHRSQDPLRGAGGIGTAADVGGRWRTEIDALAGMIGDGPGAEAAALALRYVRGRAPLFAQRVAAGRIRDGHGDLRADAVFCLPGDPRIIDCLEFSDELRRGDTLADAAFLAMDLEHLGRPDLAESFLSAFRSASEDSWPQSLAHHWIAYRAHIRAKVDLLQPIGAAERRARCQRHLGQATAHLRAAAVRLVLVGGLPGTGKTTLAGAAAARWGLPVLHSDDVRTDLFGPGPGPGAPWGAGRYTSENRTAVYREMLRRAEGLLALGQSVILDASWSREEERGAAAAVAETAASDLVAIECVVPSAVARERIRRRIGAGGDSSEADEHVAAAMAARWDPWPAALRIDTTRAQSGLLAELGDSVAPRAVRDAPPRRPPAGH